MSLINPQVLTDLEAVGFEAVIAFYQSAFAALSWNKRSFGRAFEQPNNNGADRVPKVYTSLGEYYDVLPSDQLQSFSFLMARSPERFTDEASLERDVSAVFWLDLSAVRPGVDKPSISQLSKDALQVIKDSPYFNADGAVSVYDEKIEDIFFDYIDNEMMGANKHLMFPFAGFRIDFVVGYPDPCM